MSVFKNAEQIKIPESIRDTKSWLSDEALIKAVFETNPTKAEFEKMRDTNNLEKDIVFKSYGVDNLVTKYVVYKHNYTEAVETNELIPIVFDRVDDANKYFNQYLKDRDLIDSDYTIHSIDTFDTGNEWFEIIPIKQY